jgi:hypothetical protein
MLWRTAKAKCHGKGSLPCVGAWQSLGHTAKKLNTAKTSIIAPCTLLAPHEPYPLLPLSRVPSSLRPTVSPLPRPAAAAAQPAHARPAQAATAPPPSSPAPPPSSPAPPSSHPASSLAPLSHPAHPPRPHSSPARPPSSPARRASSAPELRPALPPTPLHMNKVSV